MKGIKRSEPKKVIPQGPAPCFFVFVLLLICPPAWAAGIWSEVYLPTAFPLRAVAFTSRVDAWAGGNLGIVLRYFEGRWENFPSGTGENLNSISVLSDTDAWAAGAGGTILHYDGNKWSPSPQSGQLTLRDLNGAAFLNSNNGWIVGGNSGLGGIILKWDGAAWASVYTCSEALYDIAIVRSDYIWFCGENRKLLKFDGTTFVPGPVLLGGAGAWRALSFPYQNQGWVVGDSGSVARLAAGSWSIVPSGVVDDLYGISLLSDPTRGYIVGQNGTRILYEADTLTLEAWGGEDLFAVDMANELEGAAVGGLTAGRLLMMRRASEEAGLSAVRVFPNPLDPLKNRPLTLDRLPQDVNKIGIYTLLGEPVAVLGGGIVLSPVVGVATWDGRIHGRPAATGVYMYRIETASGKSRQGVFLVQKR